MCYHAARQARCPEGQFDWSACARLVPAKISVGRWSALSMAFAVAGCAASMVSRANRAARNRSVFFVLAAASLLIISRTVLVVASVFDPVDDGINLNTPLSGIMAALLSKQ